MPLSELKSIFRDIDKVDWQQLVHAYGRARDVPAMLWNAVSNDADERARGWDGIWGSLNHQGDFYDSTVATIPFFIRFLTCEEASSREEFLSYLYDRYLEAADYGGDPMLEDPPGGEDIPTPMITGKQTPDPTDEQEEHDWDNKRSMDLCAWQTGRAIRSGLPVYESLLNHSNKAIAGNAANLMLLWHDSRKTAQGALRSAIDSEQDPATKAELLLRYGVYGSTRDLDAFRYWTARNEPMAVRIAAAICWARAIAPAPLPDEVLNLLAEATAPECRVFGDLPWLGVYNQGLWTLPLNMAHVLLPLAGNNDDELRWRAIQGTMPGRKVEQWLLREDTCPILVAALTDPHNEVRSAAAFALAEIGHEVIRYCPDIIDCLISAVDDDDGTTSGHSARLLAALASHLNSNQKSDALKRTKAAAKRFQTSGSFVQFTSIAIQADSVLLDQHDAIRHPPEWTLAKLWQVYAFPENADNALKLSDVSRRIADLFEVDSQQVIHSAIDVLTQASDRSSVLGAAKWLTTIGPVAEQALKAIESCAGGTFDRYIDDQMEVVCRLIKEAVEFEETNCPETVDAGPVTELKMQASIGNELSSEPWRALLHHNNWLVRFQAVSAVRELGKILRSSEGCSNELREMIQPLLCENSCDMISTSGGLRHEDQIYHWWRQRRSVTAAAVQALFCLGITFESDDLLDAMLREAVQPQVRCGETVIVSEYSATEWRLACESVAGGLAIGELRVRKARQQCHKSLWLGESHDPLYAVAEHNLQEAIRLLSGRLAPHEF